MFSNIRLQTKEKKLILVVSGILVMLTGFPYILAYLLTDPGSVYLGLHALSPGDPPVYYSYIRQVIEGRVTLYNLYTSEPQIHGTFNIIWFILGIIGKWFSISPPLLFQLARLLLIPFIVWTIYIFLTFMFATYEARRRALLFVLFASGLGMYAAPFLYMLGYHVFDANLWPIDLWIPEAQVFTAIFQSPHFILSFTCTLWVFMCFIRALTQRRLKWALIAGLLSFAYFNFHPYYVPTIYGTLLFVTLWMGLKNRSYVFSYIQYYIVVIVVSLPMVYYHWWLVNQSLVIAVRSIQNITELSPLPYVLVGYGLLLPAGLMGIWYVFGKNKSSNLYHVTLIAWLMVNIFLILSPLQFESRYTQGIQFVLVIYTVIALPELSAGLRRKRWLLKYHIWLFENQTLNIVLFILLLAPTTMFILLRDVYYPIVKPSDIGTLFYMPEGVYQGLKWLEQLPRGQVVLASEHLSRFVPAYAGQRVFFGHKHETIFYDSKSKLVRALYSSDTSSEFRAHLLKQTRINYVIRSGYEAELGGFTTVDEPYLILVYQNPDIEIYRVSWQ